MNNILIYGRSQEEHHAWLVAVLERPNWKYSVSAQILYILESVMLL